MGRGWERDAERTRPRGREADAEEREFLRAVVLGLMDLEEGRETDLDEVKTRLGLV